MSAALASKWRQQAIELREEAGRIRRTVKQATDAEERCNVRAEIYDRCADELEAGKTVPIDLTKSLAKTPGSDN